MSALTTRDALIQALLGNGSGVGAVWTIAEAEPIADLLLASGAVIDAATLDWAALQASLDEEIDLGGDGSTAVTTVREWLAAALSERTS